MQNGNALIIGGGIAGLASAIALQKAGIQCDVIEIGETPVGASISISGRACEALDELGVYENCFQAGRPFTAEMSAPPMHDATGKVIGQGPSRPTWQNAKAPIGLYRPSLARILRDEAIKQGASIYDGITVRQFKNHSEGVNATLSNNTFKKYDFAIGADGIHSQTRERLFPQAPSPHYAGQMSIRWMIPSDPIQGEGWFIGGELGRLGFFHMPQENLVYVPIVLNVPEQKLSQEQAYDLVAQLLDTYTAPAVVNLKKYLKKDSIFICRPFKSILLPQPWFIEHTLLIGDAAHATTAHMGMGAGMALEDAVVLGQCISKADDIQEAFNLFMQRRFERVRTVVETSLALSQHEQHGGDKKEYQSLMGNAYKEISQPY